MKILTNSVYLRYHNTLLLLMYCFNHHMVAFYRQVIRWICLLLLSTAVPAYAALPPPIAEILEDEEIPADSIGIVILPVDGSVPLLTHNADAVFNPASAIKVVTTFAALEILGPDYQWETEFYLNGPLRGETLYGDLIVKGYGDPYLVEETLLPAVRAVRQQGLKNITGKLGIDNSYFEKSHQDPAAFDNKPHRVYNANPSALMTNFQATRFTLIPNTLAGEIEIASWPEVPRLKINNEMKLVKGRCLGSYRWPRMWFSEKNGRLEARFKGNYSKACGQRELNRAVATPADLFYGAFKSLWRYMDGTLANDYQEMSPSSKSKLFYTHYSKSLSEIIRLINKHSNNVMTKQLLLTIAAETRGSPGTPEKGRQAVNEWLEDNEIDTADLFIDNGSGLSRDARITANTLAKILQHQWYSPWMPEMISSLSIFGRDGTGKKRLNGNSLKGHMHIKTGILDHVRSMAGFYRANNGKRYIIVSLQNYQGIHQLTGTYIQDALLKWLDDIL